MLRRNRTVDQLEDDIRQVMPAVIREGNPANLSRESRRVLDETIDNGGSIPTTEAAISIANAMAVPAYVEHDERTSDFGKLTAAMLIREYEETAQRFNAMGEELQKVAKRCEDHLAEIQAMIIHTNEVAALYRDRGAEIFRWLESSSLNTTEVRAAVDELKSKVNATLFVR